MVELLPPAPAARVLEGRALATLSARSAAARRRMAVAGPPGGLGEAGRALVLPEAMGETGESEDWEGGVLVGLVVSGRVRGAASMLGGYGCIGGLELARVVEVRTIVKVMC
jgi:hypothetical protein